MANKFKRDQLVKCLPSGIAAEIGVATGDFSKIILKNNRPKKLYLIDAWSNFDLGYEDGNMVSSEDQIFRYNLVIEKFKSFNNVQIVKNKSIQALESFPNNYFDWVYIDADHSFTGCYNDLLAALPKVKDDGFICGHDYLANGFVRDGFGVNEAVHEFIKNYDLELAFLTEEKEYKSYVICRTKKNANSLKNAIEQQRIK
jgi:predicted O-methyltransferase YrrM